MSTIKYGTDPPSCTATVILFTFVYRVRPITDCEHDYITQQLTERYSKENRLNGAHQKVALALLLLFQCSSAPSLAPEALVRVKKLQHLS